MIGSQWIRKALILVLMLWFVLAFSCGEPDDDDDDNGDDDQGDDDDDIGPPSDEVEVFQDGGDLVIRNNRVSLRYHLPRGSFDVLDEAGIPVLVEAEAQAISHVLVPGRTWLTGDYYEVSWESAEAANVLGEGMSITVHLTARDDRPSFQQTFTLLDGQSCVLGTVRAINFSEEMIKIGALYPVVTVPGKSALVFGEDDDLRKLTNGAFNYVDFAAPLVHGRAGMLSNWSTLIYNQATGRSMSVGFLTYETALPVIFAGPAPGESPGQILEADCQYDPAKKLMPGDALESEVLILDFGQDTPHDALETYADRLKAWLGIRTWLERHPEIGVPVGWNSWSGSGSSGGYGTGIDEQIIVENMDFADRELRRWGMNYFQIDDGWQDHTGDWNVRTERFPDHGAQNGIAWLMDRAKGMGFQAGLWMQAFQASSQSQLIADHPDWFTEPLLGVVGAGENSLDLSNPEVLDYMEVLAERVKGWGVQWFKLDFAYWAMLTQNWHDPSLTRVEFYKLGVRRLREALGDDVLLLNVGVVGPNYGLIDSCRLTLDTMPAWEGEAEDPYGPLGMIENQGLKPMYRDAARRYYLHGRAWINHPDLIFFRAHAGESIPPLTLNEARTFATAVSLQGGLVKLGDRLVDLSPEAVDSLRRILPPVARGGRPLDMFRREFPEVWSLHFEDFDEPYHVIGLLNWGINRDLTTVPYSWITDAERTIQVDFNEAGLDPSAAYLAFEFWEQEFLGEVSGALSHSVPARSPRVVALREKLDRPQLLGANRHALGGLGVIDSVAWDPDALTLTGVQEGSVGTVHAPFSHRVTLHVPEGYAASDAEATAPEGYRIDDLQLDASGDLAILAFAVTELPGACVQDAPCRHPRVTWIVAFDH